MTLEVSYNLLPLDICTIDARMMEIDDFEVKIDGKICPPYIRDAILMGISHKAGITNKSFGQVMEEYLREKGV